MLDAPNSRDVIVWQVRRWWSKTGRWSSCCYCRPPPVGKLLYNRFLCLNNTVKTKIYLCMFSMLVSWIERNIRDIVVHLITRIAAVPKFSLLHYLRLESTHISLYCAFTELHWFEALIMQDKILKIRCFFFTHD